MNKSCSRCGAMILPGAVKCRCCGCPVSEVAEERTMPIVPRKTTVVPPTAPIHRTAPVQSAPAVSASIGKSADMNLFANTDWRSIWAQKRMGMSDLGIILTNTGALGDSSAFMGALREYVAHKAANGVEYCLLDLKDQRVSSMSFLNIESMVALLRVIYEVAVPDYLMIVGDSTVIPCADWYNGCDGDEDETVPSDLAYITLDTRSPWDGVSYDFDGVTRVGRIPAKASGGFSEAMAYFSRTARFSGVPYARSFACSALVWEPTSRAEFAHLNPNLITSPIFTSSPSTASSRGLTLLGRLSGDYNLLCFNLHGSQESHVWYGQDGGFYPEAFERGLLPENNGYVLCTEACYGARPLASASMVVSALTSGCVAFVGSSRIAYGQANGAISCADVIAQQFTSEVSRGATVGGAFLTALDVLVHGGRCSEVDIKTLAEFALYGDPSVTLVGGSYAKKAKGAVPTKRSMVREDPTMKVSLMSCNEDSFGRRAGHEVTLMSFSAEEHAHIKQMASHVSNVGNQYILEKFSSMEQVQPRVYKVMGREEYRAVYVKSEGGIKSVVNMHMDGEGNVQKIYHSK